jgi:hypothetical protein
VAGAYSISVDYNRRMVLYVDEDTIKLTKCFAPLFEFFSMILFVISFTGEKNKISPVKALRYSPPQ